MTTIASLASYSKADVRTALRHGTFTLHLGPFSHIISGTGGALVDFLMDTYRDNRVEMTPSDVTDVQLSIEAPNIVRRFVRRQITPNPGFKVPAVPLPISMSALAHEMGLNLSVALKCCRFVNVHAGVVADDEGAIVMSAASGAGKSTLTAALLQYGYRLFSDEFALIGLDKPLLHPYPRPISLKQETIPVVREMVGDNWISKVVRGSPKGDIAYYRARESDLMRDQEPAAAKLILFPNFEKGVQPVAQQLNPAEAIMRLVPASTNYSLLGEPAFHAITGLLKNTRAYEISYGSTTDSLRLVEQITGKKFL